MADLYLNVRIVRWISDDVPGFVECEFTDTDGRTWLIHEKVPVVTDADLDKTSNFPRPGVVACRIIDSKTVSEGRDEVEIDTSSPWVIESVEGVSRFRVFSDQLKVPDGWAAPTRH
jgi:hypothetical protein